MDTSGRNGTLTPGQGRAIVAILGSRTVQDAARSAGVGRSTLYSWLQNEAFRAELTRRRDEVFDMAVSRLKGLVGEAVEGLGELVHSDDERVRLSACRDVLVLAVRARDAHIDKGGLTVVFGDEDRDA